MVLRVLIKALIVQDIHAKIVLIEQGINLQILHSVRFINRFDVLVGEFDNVIDLVKILFGLNKFFLLGVTQDNFIPSNSWKLILE